MAIPKEFVNTFKNERAFVDRFIIPLFRRLGFSQIFDFQGPTEFGKDVIFGDVDAFGHPNYFGVQAKYVDSIGMGEATKLAEQCTIAFQNVFKHPRRITDEQIGRFYAVNGGEFSDHFRQVFRNALPQMLRGSVICLDGNDLLTIERTAGVRSVRVIRERLLGLRFELEYNKAAIFGGNVTGGPFGLSFMKGIREYLTKYSLEQNIPLVGLWLEASSQYVAQPFAFPDVDKQKDFYDVMFGYWSACRAIVATIDSLRLPQNKETANRIIAHALEGAGAAETAISILEQVIRNGLQRVDPLTPA